MRSTLAGPSVALALLLATPPSLVVSGFFTEAPRDPYAAGVVAVAFLDADGDGVLDPASEPVLDGWTMRLVAPETPRARAHGTSWWVDGETATVAATPPEGIELTTPDVRTVRVASGRVTTVRFGARPAREGDDSDVG